MEEGDSTRRRCCYRRCCTNQITFDDVMKIVEEQNAIIVDVRSKQEYEESHLPGAINIPLANIKRKVIYEIPDVKKCIILYCSTGMRSREAQKILKYLGYQNVYNVMDGFYG